MAESTDYQPIVQELKHWISADNLRKLQFDEAVATAKSWNIVEISHIHNLEDYFRFLNQQLTWVPSDDVEAKDILWRICTFFFIIDQPAVKDYLTPICPSDNTVPLTWLSAWAVRFGKEIGRFLDTPESVTKESLARLRASPKYNINDYIEPRLGWRSFNEFFARDIKPGRRPIAAIGDPTVIVTPTDSKFDGYFGIGEDSNITIKGLNWTIQQLLEEGAAGIGSTNGSHSVLSNTDSQRLGYQDDQKLSETYSSRFGGGTWMHMYLGPSDYHRVHAPVGGTIVESRIIPGQHYLQVGAKPLDGRNGPSLASRFDLPNELGYQFIQTRALIILDTPIGLVAVLPIGMAHVSSVVLVAEIGATVHKGEELAYFQYGGSDVVVLFEARKELCVTAQVGRHYKMGEKIAHVFGTL